MKFNTTVSFDNPYKGSTRMNCLIRSFYISHDILNELEENYEELEEKCGEEFVKDYYDNVEKLSDCLQEIFYLENIRIPWKD